ncbi:MAG: hypothetical protein ABFR75_11640 [Acidobacteriota bacterium]
MSITIKIVETKKDLKKFVKFPFKIFKGNKYWVPQLIFDEMEMFNRKKNPAYESADTRLFLAYKDGEIAGRIAAINSMVANEKYKTKNLRFGWFDAIENQSVADALFKAVQDWGKELGLETLTGPHGFSDLDQEGMLYEGYDQLPTVAVYYNHPYYNELVKKSGFEKEIDYFEFKAKIPSRSDIPEKLLRINERIKERINIRLLKFKNRKDLIKNWAEQIFEVVDEAFEEIYGSVPLSKVQVNYYIKKYLSFVDKDLVQVAVNEKDEVVGFMLALPSLSKAFQKANGRLLPFGWYHLLKGLKQKDVMDFYLAGIRNQYRGRGIDLMMVLEMAFVAKDKGFVRVESNPELETNKNIHGQWKYFEHTLHKKRRIYRKKIS